MTDEELKYYENGLRRGGEIYKEELDKGNYKPSGNSTAQSGTFALGVLAGLILGMVF